MGIRIHKALGYALIDVKHDGDEIVDKRINVENYNLMRLDEENRDLKKRYAKFATDYIMNKDNDTDMFMYDMDGFEDEMGRKIELGMVDEVKRKHKRLDYDDFYIYDAEFGMPNVFFVIPLTRSERFYRYDDDIDYYDYYSVKRDYKRNIVLLNQPIYPSTFWCDNRDGKIICNEDVRKNKEAVKKNAIMTQFKQYAARKRDSQMEKMFKRKEMIEHLENGMRKYFGFESLKEAEKHIQPRVELEVRIMCAFMGIFNDPMTVYQMKPAIYIYWS